MPRPTTQIEEASHAEPVWLERLAAEGEIRLAWLYNRKVWDRAAWLACGLGAWGMLTGYALFLLVSHEQQHPWKFMLALVLAAVASFIVESARGLIKGHRLEAINGPRLIITILTLAIVELFVIAVHAVAMPTGEEFTELRSAVFGDVIVKQVPASLTLVALAVVWTLVSAALAAILMFGVPEAHGAPRARVAKSAGLGAIVGALGAPAALLVAVVLIRIGAMIVVLCTDPGAWLGHIRWLRESHQALFWLMRPLDLFVTIWNWGAWGPALMVVAVIVVLRMAFEKNDRPGSRRGNWNALRVWLVAVAAVIVAPVVFAGFVELLKLLGKAALDWIFPAGAIGALAAALRQPSRDSRTWGTVALASASILAILTFTRLTSWWFLLPAALLVVTWLLLRGGTRLGDYWPLVALTAAFVVAGATWAGRVTFAGVYETFQGVNDVGFLMTPAPRPPGNGNLLDYPFGFGRFSGVGQPDAGLGLEWEIARFQYGSHSARLGLDQPAETKPTRFSDEDLEGLSSFFRFLTIPDPDAREIESIHAAWRRLESSTDTVESRRSGKRSLLRDRVTPKALEPSYGIVTFEKRRAYLRALQARLEHDLAEIDAALVVETEWRTCSARVRHHALAETVALWDRAQDLQKDSPGRDAKDVLDRLIGEARPVLIALEQAEVARGREALAAVSQLADSGRLPALRALTAVAAGASWRTTEGAKAAAEHLALLKAELKRGEQAAIEHRTSSDRLLETCLCASLGFWVTVGMLAGFSLLRTRGRVVRGADGQKRCFWADSKQAASFHDSEHGVAPATDLELLRRLSLEILCEGGNWDGRPSLEAKFEGFDPDKLAKMEVPGDDGSGAREACDRRPNKSGVKPLLCLIAGTSLVVENARRLLAWYGHHEAPPGKDALLADLKSRAEDPEALVAHFASLFCVRRTTPIATFLQSVGILPGAHFPGCRVASEAGVP